MVTREGLSLDEVLRSVAGDAEFRRRQSNTDYAGRQFWLGKLNEFQVDFIRAEMVKAFLSAGEYRQRFGQ